MKSNVPQILRIVLFIISILSFIYAVEYIRKFELTFTFVLTSIYLLVFIISAIYGFRFALYTNINKESFIERSYSIPKIATQAKSISMKVDEIKEEVKESEQEKESLKKVLKSKGNVFAFSEDVRLNKEERNKRDEMQVGYTDLLYGNGYNDPSIEIHGDGTQKVIL